MTAQVGDRFKYKENNYTIIAFNKHQKMISDFDKEVRKIQAGQDM